MHFFEGQKVINDLAIIHEVVGAGFQYFRDAILSFQPMISFLKPGEGLGVYIDSDEPYFRLKIEMSDQGQMRTLLLPEEFNQFPKRISGRCRIVKLLPGELQPYTSIIKLDDIDAHAAVNKILSESYQVKSVIHVSDAADQSIMVMKLPEINVNKVETNYNMSTDQYWKSIEQKSNELFERGTTEQSEIQSHFENEGLMFLGSKEIKFKCTCSRQRMFEGVRSIVWSSGIDTVFAPDEDSIETKCDYCKTSYLLMREEFSN